MMLYLFDGHQKFKIQVYLSELKRENIVFENLLVNIL